VWIRSVLRKIIEYKGEHRCILNETATTLQLALPYDIVNNNVLPFLEVPSYTFEVRDDEEEEMEADERMGSVECFLRTLTLILTLMTTFTCLKDGHEEEEEDDKYRNNRYHLNYFLTHIL